MAQKIIICEGAIGADLLQSQPLASSIADGYVVTQVSGYSSTDNRQMCVVLLSEPAEEPEENNAASDGGSSAEGGSDAEGGSSSEGGNNSEGGSGTEENTEPQEVN